MLESKACNKIHVCLTIGVDITELDKVCGSVHSSDYCDFGNGSQEAVSKKG